MRNTLKLCMMFIFLSLVILGCGKPSESGTSSESASEEFTLTGDTL